MNQEEADQNVADEVSEEVDCRGEVMRSEKNDLERVGGRARVTTDEDRVLRGVWREIKSYRLRGIEKFEDENDIHVGLYRRFTCRMNANERLCYNSDNKMSNAIASKLGFCGLIINWPINLIFIDSGAKVMEIIIIIIMSSSSRNIKLTCLSYVKCLRVCLSTTMC